MLTKLKAFWKNAKTYDFNDYINRDPDFVEIEVAEHKPPTKKQRVAYGSLFLVMLIIIDTLSYLTSEISIATIVWNIFLIVLLISVIKSKSITIGTIIKDDEYTLGLSENESTLKHRTMHIHAELLLLGDVQSLSLVKSNSWDERLYRNLLSKT